MTDRKKIRRSTKKLEAGGFKVKIVPISHLTKLYMEIENLRCSGRFSDIVYREHMAYFLESSQWL